MASKIVYEVNVTADKEIENDFSNWLDEHIKEMLKLPGFVSAELFKEETTGEKVKWTTCYRLVDKEAMENYFKNFATKMRSDALQRFSGKFSIERRVLHSLKSF